MMMAGGSTPPPPFPPAPAGVTFYRKLVFDGTAYIDTGITPTNGDCFKVKLGGETLIGPQNVFMAPTTNSSNFLGMRYGANTTSARRIPVINYASTNKNGNQRAIYWATTEFTFFLTKTTFGWDSDYWAISGGSNAINDVLVLGSQPDHTGQQYTGFMGTFYIYDSDAKGAQSADAFDNYTPKYTLWPCTYNGEAGFWCLENNTFYGNTAGAGTLSVSN